MRKNTPFPQVLGVTSFKHRVLLFSFHSLEKKNTFQIAVSKDGFSFVGFKRWAEIIKEKGQQEKIKDCQDFRISKTEESYFLTYKVRQGKSYQLSGALWGGFSHWQKTGEIVNIKETGMVVPSYRYQDKYLLYFGEKAIKIAQSTDLINWQVLTKPVFILPKKLLDKGFRLKIGTIIPTRRKILLIYFLFQNGKTPKNYSLKAVIFDKGSPGKVWQNPQKPIWQQDKDWPEKKLYPLGIAKIRNRLIAYWQTNKGEIYALRCPFFKPGLSLWEKSRFLPLLQKFIQNPILAPLGKHRWESKAVFNAATIYDKKRIHFIYRAVGDDDVSVWGYASTKDGLHIDERLKEPIFGPPQFLGRKRLKFQQPGLPFYLSGCGGFGGCEDPRITKIKDRLYITYTAFDGFNPPRVGLTSIKTDDFLNKRWHFQEPVMISPPGQTHKNWVLFPEKIKDKYAILHSLSPNILIDYFDDLNFNGKTFIKSYHDGRSNGALWEERIRGIGPPPIKTKEGWLIFYHAMDKQSPSLYKIGVMILDYQQPTKILHRARRPVLEPTKNYENEGLKPGIIYTCGAVIFGEQLLVYYGGADTVTCLATASLNKFLSQLKSDGMPKLTPRFEMVSL